MWEDHPMGPDPELSIATSWDGSDRARVAIAGEVDLATQPELRAALTEAVDKGARELVVDLERVTFLDSTGLAALIAPTTAGVTVRVEGATPAVRRVLDVVVVEGLTIA